MILWFVGPGYALVAIQTWRIIGYRVAAYESRTWGHASHIDGGNIAFGMFVGFFAGLAWPIVLTVTVELRNGWLVGAGRRFLRPPRPDRLKQREAELAARERTIEKLEREVGIQ